MRKTKSHQVAKHRNVAAPPDFVAPQLATLVDRPPDGAGWVHEIKFDGYRLLARIADGHARLITRNRNDWTEKFQVLANRIARIKAGNALLDGEVVHMTTDGTMSFHSLQNALSEGDIKNLHYFAFDLLFLDGVDLRPRPLLERKAALQAQLKNPIRFSTATIL
jgi:bifunctional non-homologous end joining protein LigD